MKKLPKNNTATRRQLLQKELKAYQARTKANKGNDVSIPDTTYMRHPRTGNGIAYSWKKDEWKGLGVLYYRLSATS